MKAQTDKPLTRKQAAFVKHIVENPKDSAVKAALSAYGKPDKELAYNTANAIAVENLQKPAIITELSKYNNLVENTLINTINDFKDSDKVNERSLATDTAKYVHDKIHGKATQKIDVQSTKVSIAIDLSKALPSQQPNIIEAS
jgi:hypothetical protein